MNKISEYEWCSVWCDERDAKAGGASHRYMIIGPSDSGGGPLDNAPVFANVQFQHGPRLAPDSTRGALDDSLLAIAQDRLEAFQAGPFAHESNQAALDHIKAARKALSDRAEERRSRGVLGKNEK